MFVVPEIGRSFVILQNVDEAVFSADQNQIPWLWHSFIGGNPRNRMSLRHNVPHIISKRLAEPEKKGTGLIPIGE
jgi:hypothetical protein